MYQNAVDHYIKILTRYKDTTFQEKVVRKEGRVFSSFFALMASGEGSAPHHHFNKKGEPHGLSFFVAKEQRKGV